MGNVQCKEMFLHNVQEESHIIATVMLNVREYDSHEVHEVLSFL